MKRSSSHKRRWGTLIEAAKSGRVSRLIGRSRSEDSVCNNHCPHHPHTHGNSNNSNSPASDDNITESPTDSNPSLADAQPSTAMQPHSNSGGGPLAALKRKRKKFSASRTMNVGDVPLQQAPCCSAAGRKQLQRASSVPARSSEVVVALQTEQQSIDMPPQQETLTPSTTEESVAASRDPLLQQARTGSASQEQQSGVKMPRNGSVVVSALPHLPGIQPVSGHNISAGWL